MNEVRMIYKDSILKKIASEIKRQKFAIYPREIHIVEDELTNLTLQDTRYFIATQILFTMIHTNPNLLFRESGKSDLLRWIKEIAENIPDSPRWHQIYRNRGETFNKFNCLHDLNDDEYKLLNIGEKESEFRIFADAYEMEGKVKKVLSNFLINLGIGTENMEIYEMAMRRIGEQLEIFQDFLTEEIEDINYWSPVRRSKKLTRAQVKILIGKKGVINMEKLILTGKKLRVLKLNELSSSIIPIFYEDIEGKFRVASNLLQLNNFLELILSLPREKEKIINDWKGTFFEDIIVDLLTGTLKVVYDPENFFTGLCTTFDDAAIKHHPQLGELLKKSKVLKYSYTFPKNKKKAKVIIKNTSTAFKDFLEKMRKDGWEVDILLVHHKEPMHVLVGECKFTNKYKYGEYEDGCDHVKKFVEFIQDNEEAKVELGIPKNYPVIPVLFTSFSGAIFRERKEVLTTTFPPILWGRFMNWTNEFVRTIS